MRLIDADRLRTRVILYFDMIQPELDQETKQYLVNEMHGLIEDMPTVDTERHGYWIEHLFPSEEHIECSQCKEHYYEDDLLLGYNDFPRYCPNCGALMDMGKGWTR